MTFVQFSGMLLAFLTNAFTIFVEKSPSPVVHAHNGLGTLSLCNYNGVLRLTLSRFHPYLMPLVFCLNKYMYFIFVSFNSCVLFVRVFFVC